MMVKVLTPVPRHFQTAEIQYSTSTFEEVLVRPSTCTLPDRQTTKQQKKKMVRWAGHVKELTDAKGGPQSNQIALINANESPKATKLSGQKPSNRFLQLLHTVIFF